MTKSENPRGAWGARHSLSSRSGALVRQAGREGHLSRWAPSPASVAITVALAGFGGYFARPSGVSVRRATVPPHFGPSRGGMCRPVAILRSARVESLNFPRIPRSTLFPHLHFPPSL